MLPCVAHSYHLPSYNIPCERPRRRGAPGASLRKSQCKRHLPKNMGRIFLPCGAGGRGTKTARGLWSVSSPPPHPSAECPLRSFGKSKNWHPLMRRAGQSWRWAWCGAGSHPKPAHAHAQAAASSFSSSSATMLAALRGPPPILAGLKRAGRPPSAPRAGCEPPLVGFQCGLEGPPPHPELAHGQCVSPSVSFKLGWKALLHTHRPGAPLR